MKKAFQSFILPVLISMFSATFAQNDPIFPSITGTGVYHGLSAPLEDLPALTEGEFQLMLIEGRIRSWNPGLETRQYPFSASALPKGPDEAWQQNKGSTSHSKTPMLNFNGQTSAYYPPDANGTAGPSHYMQTINSVYAIYNKTNGALVAGPTNMNLLFSGVTGSSCNDGDPLILYDEQASRWLAVEFSICGSNDYMLVAVSQTSDPTGSWHRYSFDVADTPDYEKFGIWQDGYYMGTNNSSGNDIYVFERSEMLTGGTPQFVGFNNPWRPSTIDGFHCVPPVDNDGPFASAGSPGLFITINDDAIGGGDDELWIYELEVNWASTGNSTFDRVQQLAVTPFDSNFGNNWDNIKQPGTNQELDAIPMILMNRPQYRKFGSYETIICCHTVDVNGNDHAGIRWYELRRTTGNWTVRQTGTYAPDGNSRWMGSIALNGNNEIALGYSISSSSVYPGIRYCGQSSSAYAAGNSVLDLEEATIQNGTNSQASYNRWGDYSNMAVDPEDDHTFWFTSQYGGSRKTKIAAFEFGPAGLNASFEASTQTPCKGENVTFNSLSGGNPTSWSWLFPGGTPASFNGENPPPVKYSTTGSFDVTLVVGDGVNSDTETATDFITVTTVFADFIATPTTIVFGNSVSFDDLSGCSPETWEWSFPGGTPDSYSGQAPPDIIYNTIGTYSVTLSVSNSSGNDSKTITNYITVTDLQYCTSAGNAEDEWIESVMINGQTHESGSSGLLGYEDFTGVLFNFSSGITHPLALDPGFPFKSNFEYWRVWIDYNRNGEFTDPGEQVFAADHIKSTATGTISIPAGLEVLTMMRVSMKRDAAPGPCGAFSKGEVEDYSVSISEPVPQPPVTDFTASATSFTGGGTVHFTDLTQNFPTSWSWSFPGGSPPTSTEQNPVIIYSTTGSFDVSLTSSNSLGSDTKTKAAYIKINEIPPATYCEPLAIENSQNYISMITIGATSSATGQGSSGYLFNPSPVFEIAPSRPYTIAVVPGNLTDVYCIRLWMDLNNDQDFFDPYELIFQMEGITGTCTGPFMVPGPNSGQVRMRVSLKSGSAANVCEGGYIGEVEDYLVSIVDMEPPPDPVSGIAMEIFPVPLDGDILNVKITGVQSIPAFEIYSGSGESVASGVMNRHEFKINTSRFKIGVYFIQVKAGNEVFVKKFIRM